MAQELDIEFILLREKKEMKDEVKIAI